MDAVAVAKLKKALCYCLPAELAREHLQVMPAGSGMARPAAIILCDEFFTFLKNGNKMLDDYKAGRISEYRAVQGLVKHIAARFKAANLVVPVRVEQVPPFYYARTRKAPVRR
mgnify:CR=1 FL=1